MDNFNKILNKLETFIKRYYLNELLKGVILFFAIGLLYFLFILFVEYTLWLSPNFRAILFWLFIAVEAGLFIKFIAIPLAKLFKLKQGINHTDASKLIGKHFPEVNDKLLNVLQLNESEFKSELLLASINQKSVELSPIPFKLAVNFKNNLSYLKYAAIPVIILLITFFTGHFDWFSSSYERVLNYKVAYEPPAPFQFFVINKSLNAIENKDFKLLVKTAGDIVPDNVKINYNGESYFLQQTGIGAFKYVFTQPTHNIQFQLSANGVYSKSYTIQVVEVPSILNFKMLLNYPKHTKKSGEVLNSTGNATVPEGTTISWQIKTKSTESVVLTSEDTLLFKSNNKGVFYSDKTVFKNFYYNLSASNDKLKNFEKLSFKINVIKDQFPRIIVQSKVDSLDQQSLYFYGKINDDYGFTDLELVYYPLDNEGNKRYIKIPFSNSSISDFISTFPGQLDIEPGIPYNLFFQVTDNDEVNDFKTAKSTVFTYRKRTETEDVKNNLEEQSKSINDYNNSLNKFDKQEKSLEELTKSHKEKQRFGFNDKKKLESFIKRQEQQDEMIKNFNQKLKHNLEKFQKNQPLKDPFKKDLQKRLDEQEKQLEKDEKLLEELKDIQDKINNEDLVKKLDELAKQNKNKKRSLEQLLELTKRFYVEKKLEKLKNDLNKLADEQEKLSNAPKEENTKAKQDKLNDQFKDFKDELNHLENENKKLKKPIDIPRDKLEENAIDKEQLKASESLEKQDNQSQNNAKQSQSKAAQKMKKMSKKIQCAMSASGGMQIQEDIDMLRQILDNLLLFSFKQETLMNQFETITSDHNKYAFYLREQSFLREHFEHIDDSLFALSLRQPKISETVNKEITNVFYNIDKSLSQFSESEIYQGVSSQQFTITSANNLSDFLSNVLDNLETQMSMAPGQGSEGDLQLPDIIMSQEQLNQMMQQGMKEGQEGQSKAGEGKNNGKEGNQGNKEGKNGKNQNGSSNGDSQNSNFESEKSKALLFEIYQQQQQLRQALEEHLNKLGVGNKHDAKNLIKQIEDIEMDLLNDGFTNQTFNKMLALKHQLLKLENASYKQEKEQKRESTTNQTIFDNHINNLPVNIKQYFMIDEILNKEVLPLHQKYKKRVSDYFKTNHD